MFTKEELDKAEANDYVTGLAGGHTGDIFTNRARQNRAYALRTQERLEAYLSEYPEEHYKIIDNCVHPITPRGWLGLDGGASDLPQRVLTELGRIEDMELFWVAVDWYAEHGSNFNAHDAAKIIRRERLRSA